MEYKKNWEKFLSLIKEGLTKQAYQTWFDSINCVGVSDSEITIEVPSRFHYEWLDSKYDKLIEKAILKSFNQKLNIKYSVIINTEPETTNIQNTACSVQSVRRPTDIYKIQKNKNTKM